MRRAIRNLQQTVNVMINNPAGSTGPGALKIGFIDFQRAIGVHSNGYVTQGIYYGSDYDYNEHGMVISIETPQI